MTNRELLELAAKAYGICLEWDGNPDDWQPMYYDGKTYHAWDPLEDYGDALRLAVRLHMTVRCYMGNTCAQISIPGQRSAYVDEWNHDDPGAAARLAIVRAAADIGKDMT